MSKSVHNSQSEGWTKEYFKEGFNYRADNERSFHYTEWTKRERSLLLAFTTSLFLVVILGFIVAGLVVLRKHENKTGDIQTSYGVADIPVAAALVSSEDTKSVSKLCETRGCVIAASELIQRMKESIDPCDDFYEFACGTFIQEAFIPDGEDGVGTIRQIVDGQNIKLRVIFEEEISEENDSPATLVKNLYSSCLDIESIDKNGLDPLRDIIDGNFGGWPVLLGSRWNEGNFSWIEAMHTSRSIGLPTNTFFDLFVSPNLVNSTQRLLWIDRPSFPISSILREFLVMGLNNSVVQAYLQYSIDVAVLMGADPSQAEEEMKEILQLQIELANISKSQEDRRELENLLNITTIQELQTLVPQIDWLDYINRMLPGNLSVTETEEINIAEVGYITNFIKILEKTSKRVIANYVTWRIITYSSQYLSDDIRELKFELLKAMSGQPSRPPRWQECRNIVSQSLGHAIGNLYVKNSFDKASKQQVEEIVLYVRESFEEILDNTDWMDSETKEEALIKLKEMESFVAFAEDLLNDTIVAEFYSELTIEAETQLIHNALNISKFDVDYFTSLLREKVNNSHWTERKPANTMDAFYRFLTNTIEIPAGILTGHAFQIDRPNYLNFGTIGSIIGHEITHGFDDQGRKFDEDGNLHNWWQSSTEQNFLDRAQCIIDQYSNFVEPETGLTLNGVNTQGENIADNGGIKTAYNAYRKWVQRHGMEDRLPGMNYSPFQLFWISNAQLWCSKSPKELLMTNILLNTHSPNRFRVNGPLINSEDFAKDFKCSPGSYMNPMKKCTVW